jgi:hypothetical protein
MSDKIRLVQGDNRPYIKLTLTDADGNAINLSDSDTVIRVYFRAVGSTEVLSTLLCSKLNGGVAGEVTFSFPSGALDVDAGQYEGEVEISFGTDKQTVYQTLKFVVRQQFA